MIYGHHLPICFFLVPVKPAINKSSGITSLLSHVKNREKHSNRYFLFIMKDFFLFKRGKLESYNSGQKFRAQYTPLISEYYYPDEVIVNSSYSERCRSTAQVFCAGLFPPKDHQIWNPNLLWQPIPINYLPRNQDHVSKA